MIDQFENSSIPFNGEDQVNGSAVNHIKGLIRVQLAKIPKGGAEQLEGYDRAMYLQDPRTKSLTGNEVKQLLHYIGQFPTVNGQISDPAYYLIGGRALETYLKTQAEAFRNQINNADENEEEIGKTEKQDIKAPPPPDVEKVTGLPRLGLELNEEIQKIKKLITY